MRNESLHRLTWPPRPGCIAFYVAQIEARTKTPSLAVLERIAKALRVPVTELLG